MRHRRSRRRRRRPPLRRRILRNRRDPQSRWITLADVILNVREQWYGFWHRVPPGARLRWNGDKVTGHYTRHR